MGGEKESRSDQERGREGGREGGEHGGEREASTVGKGHREWDTLAGEEVRFSYSSFTLHIFTSVSCTAEQKVKP